MIKKFTLLELLVVITIIGILISILLPALSKAREEAAQAVCLSNQKQCGIALLSYGTEYTAIMAFDTNTHGGEEAFWSGKL